MRRRDFDLGPQVTTKATKSYAQYCCTVLADIREANGTCTEGASANVESSSVGVTVYCSNSMVSVVMIRTVKGHRTTQQTNSPDENESEVRQLFLRLLVTCVLARNYDLLSFAYVHNGAEQ